MLIANLIKELNLFIKEVGLNYHRRRISTIELTRGTYESMGLVISPALIEDLIEIRRVRNMAAHGRMEPTLKQVKDTVTTIEKPEPLYKKIVRSALEGGRLSDNTFTA